MDILRQSGYTLIFVEGSQTGQCLGETIPCLISKKFSVVKINSQGFYIFAPAAEEIIKTDIFNNTSSRSI